MHNGNPRLAGHETPEDFLALWLDAGQSQRFLNQRSEKRDRTGLTDQRVLEPMRMHLHSADLTPFKMAHKRKQKLEMDIRWKFSGIYNKSPKVPTRRSGGICLSYFHLIAYID